MNPSAVEVLATVLLALAVLHTFCVRQFARWAHRYPEGSVGENLLHFLAETEVVFGVWAAVLFVGIAALQKSVGSAVEYIESLNYTEPKFVLVVMVAETWEWDTQFMSSHFGWRAAFSCVCSTLLVSLYFRTELNGIVPEHQERQYIPVWMTCHVQFSRKLPKSLKTSEVLSPVSYRRDSFPIAYSMAFISASMSSIVL
jgi:hypothetical protein